jgi:hypothetical protein
MSSRIGCSLLLALLGGCISTPDELREDRPSVTFETALPPSQAAQCLGRAAEAYPKWLTQDRFTGSWREGPKPGSFEVHVRRNVSPGLNLVLIDVAPIADGSRVAMYQQGILLEHDLSVEIAKRCEPRNMGARDMR